MNVDTSTESGVIETRPHRSPDRSHGWTKARASDQGGNCVQMRLRQGRIEVRDSKARRGPVLRFTVEEFVAWLDGARRGEFDHLAQE
jgi:hypothetical protein